METLRHLWHLISTPEGLVELIRWGGLPAMAAIVFAETGFFAFLPGDSLLVMAGFVAATTGALDPWTMIGVLSLAAILGDTTGFWIGRKAGPPLYNRPDSRFFKREHLLRTHEFYEKHGASTIVIARFVPIVRTFAPVVAGVAEMPYRTFLLYNVAGGVGWVASMILVGYFFGQIPFVQRHLEKVILLVVVVSLLPVALHALKARRSSPRR